MYKYVCTRKNIQRNAIKFYFKKKKNLNLVNTRSKGIRKVLMTITHNPWEDNKDLKNPLTIELITVINCSNYLNAKVNSIIKLT